MKKSMIALAVAGLVSVPAFAADAPAPEHSFTANVGVVSNYIFRGISQSQNKGAVQGGVDYAHSSGLYAGVWGSTVKWVDQGEPTVTNVYKDDNKLELDLYGGYKGALGPIAFDLGAIRYYYPGDFNKRTAGYVTPDTSEVYLGLSYDMFSFKYNQVVSDYFVGWGDATKKSKGSEYYDFTVTYPFSETVSVIGHVGHQYVAGFGNASYTDWKLGVTKDVGYGVFGLSYTDTDADKEAAYLWTNKKVARSTVFASFTKSF